MSTTNSPLVHQHPGDKGKQPEPDTLGGKPLVHKAPEQPKEKPEDATKNVTKFFDVGGGK